VQSLAVVVVAAAHVADPQPSVAQRLGRRDHVERQPRAKSDIYACPADIYAVERLASVSVTVFETERFGWVSRPEFWSGLGSVGHNFGLAAEISIVVS